MAHYVLTLKDGEQWIGTLADHDNENGIITLRNPELCGTGKKFCNDHTFHDVEIESIQQVKNDSVRQKTLNEQDIKQRLEKRKIREKEEKNLINIISDFSDDYFKAINDISQEKRIALAMEGIHLGRRGLICFLQIKAANYIYVFDMLLCGEQFIQSGLKAIIEDENIVKVIHDSRYVSDALYHRFGVELCNVFDTQVADIIVRRNSARGILPKYVRDLETCLRDYLKLPPGKLHLASPSYDVREERQMDWKKRPVPEPILFALADSVCYLRKLQTEMERRLLMDVTMGTDCFLQYVRDLSEKEFAMTRSNNVPENFLLCLPGQNRKSLLNKTLPNTSYKSLLNKTLPNTSYKSLLNKRLPNTSYNSGLSNSLNLSDKSSPSTTPPSNLQPKFSGFGRGAFKRVLEQHGLSPASSQLQSAPLKSQEPMCSSTSTNNTNGKPFIETHGQNVINMQQLQVEEETPENSRGLGLPPAGMRKSDLPKDMRKWEKLNKN